MKKFIKTSLNDYLNEKHETSLELFKSASKDIMNNIEGGFLNKEQANELQKEIESNYTPTGEIRFGKYNKDIRTNVFNYDNPLAQKFLNGIDLRIAEGLIRDKRKTYLLYANGEIIGEFYHVADIKNIIKYIEDRLIKKIE